MLAKSMKTSLLIAGLRRTGALQPARRLVTLAIEADGAADHRRLMNGQQADMVLTDPPWNLPTRYFSGRGRHRRPDFVMARGEKSEDEFIDFLAINEGDGLGRIGTHEQHKPAFFGDVGETLLLERRDIGQE